MRSSSLFVAGLVCGLSGTAMSQTKPPSSGATSLPSVEVGAPKRTASIRTSASDAPVYGRVAPAGTTSKCSVTTWPNVSPVQCMKPRARNYVECTENVVKNGNRSSDAWWWCSNLGFKN